MHYISMPWISKQQNDIKQFCVSIAMEKLQELELCLKLLLVHQDLIKSS